MKQRSELSISLGTGWSTLERQLLIDMERSSSQMGLICQKDSFIDFEATKRNIKTIEVSRKSKGRRFHLKTYLKLRNLFSDLDFHSTHCYGIHGLFEICLAMRRRPICPLFLTLNSFPEELRRGGVFQTLLLNRIDQTYVFSEELRDALLAQRIFRAQKVDVTPLEHHFKVTSSESERPPQKEVTVLVIRYPLFLSTHMALSFIAPLKASLDKRPDLKVFFFCDRNWSENSPYYELSAELVRQNLGHKVQFCSDGLSKEFIETERIVFLDPFCQEEMSDWSLSYIEAGIEGLVPRTMTLHALSDDLPWLKTFAPGDWGGMRRRLDQILLTSPLTQKNLRKPFILNDYLGGRSRGDVLSHHATLAEKKRMRFFSTR